ncbi:tetratricopeptide repeat protein [Glacieibacterium megasporae]|uniref:tetratricopeptide repeat protein n=1 Tax=Glacieibacterium megasporae TaxID=2835787 RepID=UPI001C1E35FF|nr:hypothetical protein [Polymorphobacter megasporae]UAJ08632.1 hypothetical protein KTC28_09460 [Polymorphobacter megasporae]
MADSPPNTALKGWKSIADYFGRDQSTVMRWAAQRGLPVRRMPGAGRSSIYALPNELAAWLQSERPGGALATPADITPVATDIAAPPAPVGIAEGFRRRRLAYAGAGAVAVAGAVVAAIIISMRAPVASPSRPAFADPAVERDYLAATYDLDLRSPASLNRAVGEFGAVIARDPGAAPAYAALGETYLMLREYTAFPSDTAYRAAAAAAQAAVALDPGLLAAHRVLAFVAFWGNLDLATARAEFARARAIAPRDAQTWHWYATALSANGEAAAALDAIGEARRLEPQSTPIAADYGLIAYLAGRRDEGLAALHAVAAGSPSHMSSHRYLADLALARGDGTTYLAEAAIACRLKGDAREAAGLASDRVAFQRGGEAGLLEEIASRMAATGQHFDRARIAALQGRRDFALAELRAAAAAHETGIAGLPGEVMLRSLAGDPMFDAMRRRASLATGADGTV